MQHIGNVQWFRTVRMPINVKGESFGHLKRQSGVIDSARLSCAEVL